MLAVQSSGAVQFASGAFLAINVAVFGILSALDSWTVAVCFTSYIAIFCIAKGIIAFFAASMIARFASFAINCFAILASLGSKAATDTDYSSSLLNYINRTFQEKLRIFFSTEVS